MGDVCNVVFEEGFEWRKKGKNWGSWVDFALLGYALLVYALLGFARRAHGCHRRALFDLSVNSVSQNKC
jgi:hypothetical protein